MDTLPQDLWHLLASFLDVKTQRQMRLANTQWFNTIKYNNFTLYFTRKGDIPVITERLSKYLWPIKLNFQKSRFTNATDLLDHLPQLTNLVELKFTADVDDIPEEKWMQLSVLTNLEELWLPFTEIIPLRLWTYLRKINTWYPCFPEGNIASPLVQMPNLKTLHFFGPSTTWPFSLVQNPEKLERIHMLVHTITNGNDTWSRLTNLIELICFDRTSNQTLELAYLTALTRLKIIREVLPFISCTNLKQLEIQDVKKWSIANAEALSNLTNLQELYFNLPSEPEQGLEFSFLSHLPKLTRLTIKDNSSVRLSDTSILFPYIPINVRAVSLQMDCNVGHLYFLTNLESLELKRCSQTNQYKILWLLTKLTHLYCNHWNADQNFTPISRLTGLKELHMDATLNAVIGEEQIPDLAKSTDLIKLYWGFHTYPPNKLEQLKFLTKLQELTIADNEFQNSLENCDFLAGLVNLTHLAMEVGVNMDSFAQCVTALTNLRYLTIHTIDTDDRILCLTSLPNLTSLTITNGGENFRGVHFTALTSLQELNFFGDRLQLVHDMSELQKALPYLMP